MSYCTPWRFGLASALSVAVVILPAIATAQPSSIEMSVDTPADGATISNGQPVTISGWAVDGASSIGTGIASVEISLDSQNGTASEPLVATYGTLRADVADTLGRPDWAQSGFTITWTPDSIPNGPQTIRVWVNSTQQVSKSVALTVMAVAPPTPQTADSLAQSQATPTMTSPPGVRIGAGPCDLDFTLVAPDMSPRRCPHPTETPTPHP